MRRLDRVLAPLRAQPCAGVSIHWHLPDSIKDMTPAQLSALTTGTVAPTEAPTEAPVADAEAEAVYAMEDVAAHATRDDCWIVVGDGVYDVTEFMEIHPGGIGMLQMIAGKDATQHFQEMHRPEILTTIGAAYRIGSLQGGVPTEAQVAVAAAAVAPAAIEPAAVIEPVAEADAEAVYTMEDVAAHGSREDCWIAVEGGVYDVTEFMEIHPGGIGMLKMVAGKDATQHFQEMHRPEILTTIGAAYRIGTLEGFEPPAPPAAVLPAEAPAPMPPDADASSEDGGLYTMEEVSLHGSKEDCWVVVQGGVYDVTDFLAIHPGGAGILAGLGGKDATDFFMELHRPQVLEEVAAEYKIGSLVGSDAAGGGAGAGSGGGGGASAAGGAGGAAAAAAADSTVVGTGSAPLVASPSGGEAQYSMVEVEAAVSSGGGNGKLGWVVLHDGVYDFTSFLDKHPGGERAILRLSGTDATAIFTECHTPEIYRVRTRTVVSSDLATSD
jgi:cytochrome b involved in lipid metabolism